MPTATKARPQTGILVNVVDLSADLAETLERINAAAEALNPGCEKATELLTDKIGYVMHGNDMFVICTEGVGDSEPITDENPHKLGLRRSYDRDGHKSVEMMAAFTGGYSRSDIEELPMISQVPLEKFIRVFGNRLESNFRIWHRVLSA